jgi:hypothetical protein
VILFEIFLLFLPQLLIFTHLANGKQIILPRNGMVMARVQTCLCHSRYWWRHIHGGGGGPYATSQKVADSRPGEVN